MGEIGLRRHLRAAAAVSFAALAAACAGNRHEAPVIMKGAAPDQVEAAPIAPTRARPKIAAPKPLPSPTGPAKQIVVRPGQSVGYLAREYGVTKRAIIDANNLTPPEYKIEIGQQLRHSRRHRAAPVGASGRGKAVVGTAAGAHGRIQPGGQGGTSHPARRSGAGAEEIGGGSGDQLSAAGCSGAGNCRRRPPSRLTAPQPAEKDVASAEAEEPPSRSEHLPWPVRGRVVAGYGATKGGGHNAGINIAAARGAPVRAVDAGVVAYAGNEIRGYGNLVLVKHPNGLISAYAHLNSLARQPWRYGQPRPGDREGRQYRRGQRAAAPFRAAPRQEGGRSARVAGAGDECRRRERNRGLEMPEPEWRRLNRLHWDDRVAIHLGPRGYDLDRLRTGQEPLNGIEAEELPPLAGKRVLHLQCHFGADSLKLLQRGAAEIVGVDFSPPAIAAAQAWRGKWASPHGRASSKRMCTTHLSPCPSRTVSIWSS